MHRRSTFDGSILQCRSMIVYESMHSECLGKVGIRVCDSLGHVILATHVILKFWNILGIVAVNIRITLYHINIYTAHRKFSDTSVLLVCLG